MYRRRAFIGLPLVLCFSCPWHRVRPARAAFRHSTSAHFLGSTLPLLRLGPRYLVRADTVVLLPPTIAVVAKNPKTIWVVVVLDPSDEPCPRPSPPLSLLRRPVIVHMVESQEPVFLFPTTRAPATVPAYRVPSPFSVLLRLPPLIALRASQAIVAPPRTTTTSPWSPLVPRHPLAPTAVPCLRRVHPLPTRHRPISVHPVRPTEHTVRHFLFRDLRK